MDHAALRRQIDEAVAHEHAERELERIVVQAWIRHGVDDPGVRATESTLFLIRYVEAAPELLEMTMDAASTAGAGEALAPFFDAAAAYLTEEADFIPDDAGLVGLIDDAYLIQSLLQRLSDRYSEGTGTVLLPFDLAGANGRARAMIGEPVASQLDTAVNSLMQLREAEFATQCILELITQLPANAHDPYSTAPTPTEYPDLELSKLFPPAELEAEPEAEAEG